MANRTARVFGFVVALVWLTACGGGEAESNPNADACKQFVVASDRLVDLDYSGKGAMSDAAYTSALKDAFNQLDTVALKATGDVKVRLEELVRLVPEGGRIIMVGAKYNDQLARIKRACAVEGVDITPRDAAELFR